MSAPVIHANTEVLATTVSAITHAHVYPDTQALIAKLVCGTTSNCYWICYWYFLPHNIYEKAQGDFKKGKPYLNAIFTHYVILILFIILNLLRPHLLPEVIISG